MATPRDRAKARRDKARSWARRRVYLSEEDLAILQQLQAPAETRTQTLRRALREALARKPVAEALRGLEARLARIEAAGARLALPAASASPTPPGDREEIQRVAQAHRRHFQLEQD